MSPFPKGLHVVDRPPEDGSSPLDAPVVVLVHGSLDRAASFRRVARRLPDLELLTYDRRGYQGSRGEPGDPAPTLGTHVEDLLGIVAAAKQTLHLARSARRPRPVNPNALPQPCRLVLEAARAPRQDRADSATMVIPMPQPKPAPVSPLPPASPPPRMPPAQPQPLPLATTEDDREPAIGDPAVQRKILTFADPARS